MSLCALSTLFLYSSTFDTMRWLVAVLPKTNLGYLEFNLASHGIALDIMLPTTFCAGMTLPLITYVLLRQHGGERSIGAVYAANTVGAIVGVFFAIHVGLPLLGLKPLIISGAALDMALGLVLLWRRRGAVRVSVPLGATALCTLGVVATLLCARLDVYQMASGVYRTAQEPLRPSDTRLLFHQDGKTATVDLLERNGFVSIRTNGKVDAQVNMRPAGESTLDEPTMVLLGALPLLLHPQARTAANIGLGSGITTHVLLSTPTLLSVDTIEIEAAMVQGGPEASGHATRAPTAIHAAVSISRTPKRSSRRTIRNTTSSSRSRPIRGSAVWRDCSPRSFTVWCAGTSPRVDSSCSGCSSMSSTSDLWPRY